MTKLMEQYREWREVTEEMLADGFRGTTCCGEKSVREDFTAYAELEKEITFEEMLELERAYPNSFGRV